MPHARRRSCGVIRRSFVGLSVGWFNGLSVRVSSVLERPLEKDSMAPKVGENGRAVF